MVVKTAAKALVKVEMMADTKDNKMVATTVYSVDKMVATTALSRVALLVGEKAGEKVGLSGWMGAGWADCLDIGTDVMMAVSKVASRVASRAALMVLLKAALMVSMRAA